MTTEIRIDNQKLVGLKTNQEGKVINYELSNGILMDREGLEVLHNQGKIQGLNVYRNITNIKVEPLTATDREYKNLFS